MNKNSPLLITMVMVLLAGGAVVGQYRYANSIVFKDAVYAEFVQRGPDGEQLEAVYGQEQLTEFHGVLTSALVASYDAQNTSKGFRLFKRPDFELGIRFLEVFGGSLMVNVDAYTPGTDTVVKNWEKVLTKDQDMPAELTALAEEVASALVAN